MRNRWASALAVVGSLTGAAALPGAAEQPLRVDKLKTRMTRMAWFISYVRTTPPFQMSMLVVAGEGCLLEVQNPMPSELPVRPELGSYYWKNPPADGEALRDLLLKAQSEEDVTKRGPTLPGVRFVTFGLGKKGADQVDQLTAVPLSQPLGPQVQAFNDAVLALARKAQDHPYMLLRAKGALHTKQLAPDGELLARLDLTNAGIVPVVAFNPAHADSPAQVALVIKDHNGDLQLVDVRPGEIAASTGSSAAPQLAATTDAKVKLAPGDVLSLSLRIRRHIYLGRGHNQVALRYTSSAHDLPEGDGLDGFVDAAAGNLEAAKRGAHPK